MVSKGWEAIRGRNGGKTNRSQKLTTATSYPNREMVEPHLDTPKRPVGGLIGDHDMSTEGTERADRVNRIRRGAEASTKSTKFKFEPSGLLHERIQSLRSLLPYTLQGKCDQGGIHSVFATMREKTRFPWHCHERD